MTKKGITISDIMNEAQLEMVTEMCSNANCGVTISDFSTKAKITGTNDQIQAFVIAWNE